LREATVFSQSRRIAFHTPTARNVVEDLLKAGIANIGRQLATDNAILGHIKLAGSLPAESSVLFLSQTMLDRVDVRTLPGWVNPDCQGILEVEIAVNVMVFSHSQETVTNAVNSSLQGLGDVNEITGNS
jgi:hypothetical protein